MRRAAFTVIVAICGIVLIAACIVRSNELNRPPIRTQADPRVIIETLDPTLEHYAPMWQQEIGRRFDNAVGILCHGGDFVAGDWILGTSYSPHNHVTPAREIVAFYQKRHPGRTVILLACNTGHVKLGMPGVWYFKNMVWCVPDRALTPEMFKNGMAHQKLALEEAECGVQAAADTPMPSRWQVDADANGNIYEAVSD